MCSEWTVRLIESWRRPGGVAEGSGWWWPTGSRRQETVAQVAMQLTQDDLRSRAHDDERAPQAVTVHAAAAQPGRLMLRLMIARVVWAASRSSRTEMVEESGARACLAMMAIGAITAAAVSRRLSRTGLIDDVDPQRPRDQASSMAAPVRPVMSAPVVG